jgi:hypothetical protein
LAKPDQFVWDLAQISNFKMRTECWLFRTAFAESIFALKERLSALAQGCKELHGNRTVVQVIVVAVVCNCGS